MSYKELARELPKPLVLQSTTGNINVTLTADTLEKIVTDQMSLTLQETGYSYEVPLTFLQMHVGDFKVIINSVPLEIIKAKGQIVNDDRVDVVVAKDVKIGYDTNKTPVSISISEQAAIGETYVKMPYAFLKETTGSWEKGYVTNEHGVLQGTMNGTSRIALAKYYPTYTDIAGHWAESIITTLLARGTADRINTELFEPNGVITRGELVRMLINIVGTEGKSENMFVDVPVGSPYSDIVESIIYYGFTIGVEGDKFEAYTPLTREDLVVYVARMYEVKYGHALDKEFVTFKDMNDVSPYAREAVMAMKATGYISGYEDNTFRPKQTVMRAMAVVILWKILGNNRAFCETVLVKN